MLRYFNIFPEQSLHRKFLLRRFQLSFCSYIYVYILIYVHDIFVNIFLLYLNTLQALKESGARHGILSLLLTKTVFHRIISVVRLHVLSFLIETLLNHDDELWRFFLSVKPACRQIVLSVDIAIDDRSPSVLSGRRRGKECSLSGSLTIT